MRNNNDFLEIVTDGYDMSTDFTSDPILTRDNEYITVQFNVSGGTAPTGDLITQGSLDGLNWYNLESDSISDNGIVAQHGAGLTGSVWIRVLWDRTSGDGDLTIIVHAKG